MLISGIVSIFLEKNWWHGLKYIWKIPLYAHLASSLTFSLVFAFVDSINMLIGLF